MEASWKCREVKKRKVEWTSVSSSFDDGGGRSTGEDRKDRERERESNRNPVEVSLLVKTSKIRRRLGYTY